MSLAFDFVGEEISRMVETAYGGELFFALPRGIKQRLETAPHKDHIHFYKSSDGSDSAAERSIPMVPEHTDNGLFLIITPFPGQSLVVRTRKGKFKLLIATHCTES